MSYEEEMLKRRERARLESEPMLKELQSTGVDVDNVWDIRHPDHYPECIPVLLKYLSSNFQLHVFRGIQQKLRVKEVDEYWDEVIAGYRAQPDDKRREAIANVIIELMNKEKLHDIEQLLKDQENGQSRILILGDLKSKIRGERSRSLIEELVDDPEIGWFAREKLGRK